MPVGNTRKPIQEYGQSRRKHGQHHPGMPAVPPGTPAVPPGTPATPPGARANPRRSTGNPAGNTDNPAGNTDNPAGNIDIPGGITQSRPRKPVSAIESRHPTRPMVKKHQPRPADANARAWRDMKETSTPTRRSCQERDSQTDPLATRAAQPAISDRRHRKFAFSVACEKGRTRPASVRFSRVAVFSH